MIVRTIATVALLASVIAIPARVIHAQQQQQQGVQQQQQQQQGSLAEVPLSASLLGAEVVGDSAAVTGSAKAALTLRHASKEICYDLTFTDLADVTDASINKGAKGVNGPPVLALQLRSDTTVSKGCAKAEDATFNEILASPSEYYIQVNTQKSPTGAIRGQLKKHE